MSTQPIEFIEKNRDHFLEGLKELIRVESVSTQPDKKPEVLRCADLEVKKFRDAGLENVRLLSTSGYPLVYGDWLHSPGKPTVLIYGHYDVQPPDPLDLWESPPFEPTVKNGSLYGRGTSDNKGQHFTYLCAIEAYLKTAGRLPVNVKIVLEGEEECGSAGIETYFRAHSDFFACDLVMISDSPWLDADHPAICYGTRGLVYFQIEVEGPSHDLHSGLYGGMIQNPLQAVSWMLAKLKDERGKILIPHFYDDVAPIEEEERVYAQTIPFREETLRQQAGVAALTAEEGFTPLESNWFRPALEICGVGGGYQGAGAKTIIPAKAAAKVNIRLVAHQDPKKVDRQFRDYLETICPPGIRLQVTCLPGSCGAFWVDRRHPLLLKVAKAYGQAFGKEWLLVRNGATIPINASFQEVLKVPVILVGLGLPDDRLHAPNEKFSLNNFYGGIRGAVLAFQEVGGL